MLGSRSHSSHFGRAVSANQLLCCSMWCAIPQRLLWLLLASMKMKTSVYIKMCHSIIDVTECNSHTYTPRHTHLFSLILLCSHSGLSTHSHTDYVCPHTHIKCTHMHTDTTVPHPIHCCYRLLSLILPSPYLYLTIRLSTATVYSHVIVLFVIPSLLIPRVTNIYIFK